MKVLQYVDARAEMRAVERAVERAARRAVVLVGPRGSELVGLRAVSSAVDWVAPWGIY